MLMGSQILFLISSQSSVDSIELTMDQYSPFTAC